MNFCKVNPRDLLPLPEAFDFSNVRPGNVVRFRLSRDIRLDRVTACMVVAAIGSAAIGSGLSWEARRDKDELRISFR
jgi:hypothetical protein